ncbi:MAG: GNAT family N-acetyltransferase, partial [Chryseobacterium sp.]
MNSFKSKTKDLLLRPVRLEDALEIFSLVDESRDSLRQFLPWLNHNKTVKDSEKFLQSCVLAMEKKNFFTFAIIDNGCIAGIVSYHPIDWTNKTADLGYWVSVNHRGRGLGRWAVSELLKHAFDELNLNRISIACAIENQPSQR